MSHTTVTLDKVLEVTLQHMPQRGLEALKEALVNDDPRLIQGATTTPPPLACMTDWPVEAACLIGFCGWEGNDLKTVGEVEEFFAKSLYEIDQDLAEPAACRHALNWFDDTPRGEMRKELLPKVEAELTRRAVLVA